MENFTEGIQIWMPDKIVPGEYMDPASPPFVPTSYTGQQMYTVAYIVSYAFISSFKFDLY